MINQKDIYVGLNLPSNNEPLWIKPLTDGNVALYARVYGEWIAANSHALYYTKAEIDEFLAGKANSGYTDEHKGMLRNNDTTEFYNFDNLWRTYLGAWGLTLSRGENTGIITYDGELKVNDKAVATTDQLVSDQQKYSWNRKCDVITDSAIGVKETIFDPSLLDRGEKQDLSFLDNPYFSVGGTITYFYTENTSSHTINGEVFKGSLASYTSDPNQANATFTFTALLDCVVIFYLAEDNSITTSATHAQILNPETYAYEDLKSEGDEYILLLTTGQTVTIRNGTKKTSGLFINYFAKAQILGIKVVTNKITIPAAQVQADWSETNTSSAAYIANKPTIPSVNDKADKVVGATAGHFANLDANGNLVDSLHSVSDFEQTMEILTPSGTTLSAQVGKYYRMTNVNSLTVTLPNVSSLIMKPSGITFLIKTSSTMSGQVTFQSNGTRIYQNGFTIDAGTTNEVTAIWNTLEWTITNVVYN